MTQAEALKVLEKGSDWMTSKEISTKMNNGVGSTNSNLRKLINEKLIERKRDPNFAYPRYLWKIKKKLKT